MESRKFPLQFQQKSGKRIGIPCHLIERFLVYLRYFIEISQLGLGFKYPSVVIQYGICTFFIIVFVMNFAHNLLNNVLHGDNARRTTELIDHNGYMNLVCLEIAQQIINHLGFGHKIGGPDKRLPTEIIPFVQMGKQILDIKHPLDIVTAIRIDGNTGVDILYDALHHIFERGTDIQVHHIKARGHDLLSRFPAKADDTFQNIILLRKLCLVGQLQRMREFIDRYVMVLADHMLVQERGGTYQHRCHRIEYGTAKRDAGSGKTAESQRLLSRIYLRHDFTEKQQQKCKDYCQNEELCNGRMKLEHIHKEEVAEHDYGYIYEVVRNQNRCQQTFAVVQQITDFLIRRMLSLRYCIQV